MRSSAPLRVVAVAAPSQVIDRPEAADPESAFPRRQAVTARLVPVEETVASEPRMDEVERPAHARIVRSFVSKASHEQQRRVHPVSIELAHVATKAFIEAPRLYHRADLVALLPEARRVDADKAAFRELDHAVERCPAHHFREGVVPLRPANLPNAIIRFAPFLARGLPEASEKPRLGALKRSAALHVVERRRDDAAVDVELHLRVRAVSDAHRA